MKISFDLDGVLYPWQEVIIQHINLYEKLSEPVTLDTFTSHLEKHNKLYLDYLLENPTFYSVRSPRSMDVELVNELHNTGHEIYYITARPQNFVMQDATRKWLENWSFPCIENLIFSTDKRTTLVENDIDIHIEDQLKHVESAKNHCKVFLVTMPWNKDYVDTAVTRLSDLTELRNYV
jgi:5'(3')-deoxyribonucleotidase